jgi:hypothetical protein
MSYAVTIRVLGPATGDACRPPVPGQTCQRPAFYTIATTQDQA